MLTLGEHNSVIPAAWMKEDKEFPYPIYAALAIQYLLLKRYPRTLSSPLPHKGAGYSMHAQRPIWRAVQRYAHGVSPRTALCFSNAGLSLGGLW